MKKFNVIFILLFIFCTYNFAIAITFNDNFDDPVFTDKNWIQAIPQWNFSVIDEIQIQ